MGLRGVRSMKTSRPAAASQFSSDKNVPTCIIGAPPPTIKISQNTGMSTSTWFILYLVPIPVLIFAVVLNARRILRMVA